MAQQQLLSRSRKLCKTRQVQSRQVLASRKYYASGRLLPNRKLTQALGSSVQIFATDQDLIDTLIAWRKSHNDDPPPGGVKEKRDEALKEVKVASGLATVGRLQVDPKYMCWVLRYANGTSALVKTWSGGQAGAVRYRGWLGGDMGFTNYHIATCPRPTPSNNHKKPLSVAETSPDWSSEDGKPLLSRAHKRRRVTSDYGKLSSCSFTLSAILILISFSRHFKITQATCPKATHIWT